MHSVGFRQAAVALYRHLQSLRQVARILQVSIASISRWMRRLIPLQRRRTGFLHNIQHSVQQLLDSRPFSSAVEISNTIASSGTSVSRQTVSRVIQTIGYSYKRAQTRGSSLRSTEQRPKLLQEFVSNYTLARCSGHPLIAVDESGFDHRDYPRYGYARKGHQVILTHRGVSNIRTRRYSLLMAVANDRGDSSHILTSSSITGARFADFITALPYPPGTTILLDNASIHKTIAARQAMSQKEFTALFVPPYTPEFNPIELVFGYLKQRFRKDRVTETPLPIDESVNRLVQQARSTTLYPMCWKHVDRLVAETAEMKGA
jgi:transposase